MARGGLAHLLATLLLFVLLATSLAVGASEAEADLTPAAPAQGVSEAAAAEPDADAQQHLLPRPLVIELPSARAAEEPDPYADVDDVPTDVRCASWRLAAEANNLAPWKALPPECAQHVRDYVTSAAYRSDLELVARESTACARAASISSTAYARAATISSTAISFFLAAAAREVRLHLAPVRSGGGHVHGREHER